MDEAEQDQYEARLKELFDSFDSTGTGSLGQEELTDLCHVLHLEEVAPALQQTLLQDNLLGRVRPGWARGGFVSPMGTLPVAELLCAELFGLQFPIKTQLSQSKLVPSGNKSSFSLLAPWLQPFS